MTWANVDLSYFYYSRERLLNLANIKTDDNVVPAATRQSQAYCWQMALIFCTVVCWSGSNLYFYSTNQMCIQSRSHRYNILCMWLNNQTTTKWICCLLPMAVIVFDDYLMPFATQVYWKMRLTTGFCTNAYLSTSNLVTSINCVIIKV